MPAANLTSIVVRKLHLSTIGTSMQSSTNKEGQSPLHGGLLRLLSKVMGTTRSAFSVSSSPHLSCSCFPILSLERPLSGQFQSTTPTPTHRDSVMCFILWRQPYSFRRLSSLPTSLSRALELKKKTQLPTHVQKLNKYFSKKELDELIQGGWASWVSQGNRVRWNWDSPSSMIVQNTSNSAQIKTATVANSKMQRLEDNNSNALMQRDAMTSLRSTWTRAVELQKKTQLPTHLTKLAKHFSEKELNDLIQCGLASKVKGGRVSWNLDPNSMTLLKVHVEMDFYMVKFNKKD